jgi:hypothetical protein
MPANSVLCSCLRCSTKPLLLRQISPNLARKHLKTYGTAPLGPPLHTRSASVRPGPSNAQRRYILPNSALPEPSGSAGDTTGFISSAQTSTSMYKAARQRDASAADVPTDIHIPETSDAAVAVIRLLMNQFRLDPAVFVDDNSGLSSSLFLCWNLVH